ncbi:hypothetical protein AMATHDRAFT_3256 [Amanita thiersii Skay4041]|uniref:Uncharacterized protein n=1 Tax=Amanita thiersii Skay4041 TaxID=703135 RepID=A0A2A9NKN2_9AGAR|nr:hypothetical protein AMATHDRAFT_3256 [Amanita thiersii Skay4041]
MSGSSSQLRNRLIAASAYLIQATSLAATLYASQHYWMLRGQQQQHTAAMTLNGSGNGEITTA